jgi:hypothetical protein
VCCRDACQVTTAGVMLRHAVRAGCCCCRCCAPAGVPRAAVSSGLGAVACVRDHAPCRSSRALCGLLPGAGLFRGCLHPAAMPAHPACAGQPGSRARWAHTCAATQQTWRVVCAGLLLLQGYCRCRQAGDTKLHLAQTQTRLCGRRWSVSSLSMYQASMVTSDSDMGCPAHTSSSSRKQEQQTDRNGSQAGDRLCRGCGNISGFRECVMSW